MSRYSKSQSTSHRCVYIGSGDYRISWVVDFYYPNSRLRHPRRFRRETDEAGAKRFCKRWGIEMPVKP
jgi:hypothetical protein